MTGLNGETSNSAPPQLLLHHTGWQLIEKRDHHARRCLPRRAFDTPCCRRNSSMISRLRKVKKFALMANASFPYLRCYRILWDERGRSQLDMGYIRRLGMICPSVIHVKLINVDIPNFIRLIFEFNLIQSTTSSQHESQTTLSSSRASHPHRIT